MVEQQTRANCSTVSPLKCQKYFAKQSLFISYRLLAPAFTLIMDWFRSIHRNHHLQRNEDKWCSSQNRTTSFYQKLIFCKAPGPYSAPISCYLWKIKPLESYWICCLQAEISFFFYLRESDSQEKSLLQIQIPRIVFFFFFFKMFSLFLNLVSFCMRSISHIRYNYVLEERRECFCFLVFLFRSDFVPV